MLLYLGIIIAVGYKNYRDKVREQEAKELYQEYIETLQIRREQEEKKEEQEKIREIQNKLEISDLHGFSNDKAQGTLTNNSDTTVYFVQVKFKFVTRSEEVVDTESTYAVGSEGLAPGESCVFNVYNNYASMAGYTFTVEVYDLSVK